MASLQFVHVFGSFVSRIEDASVTGSTSCLWSLRNSVIRSHPSCQKQRTIHHRLLPWDPARSNIWFGSCFMAFGRYPSATKEWCTHERWAERADYLHQLYWSRPHEPGHFNQFVFCTGVDTVKFKNHRMFN